MKSFHVKKTEDLEYIHDELMNNLKDNKNILCLMGDLGVGKTTFTQLICQKQEVKDIVNSPTFVIMKRYNGKDFNIIHTDSYRLENGNDLRKLGFDEWKNEEKSLVIIEWPEIVKDLIEENIDNCIFIHFSHMEEGDRMVLVYEKGEFKF